MYFNEDIPGVIRLREEELEKLYEELDSVEKTYPEIEWEQVRIVINDEIKKIEEEIEELDNMYIPEDNWNY